MATIRDLERRAGEVLPPDVYAWYAAGSGDNRTLSGQEAAWDGVELRPRVLRDVSATSTATDVLGLRVSTPVRVAPTASQLLADPQGEVAAAPATREAGSIYVPRKRPSRGVT